VPSSMEKETWREKNIRLFGVDLSFSDVPEWKRTKHVHRLHPYLGKFIPQLAEIFLRKYFKLGETVLDPFAGSGTTLVEASVLGINSIGIDISKFNCLLSRVKTDDYSIHLMQKEVGDILQKTEQFSKAYLQNKGQTNLNGSTPHFETESIYLNEWFAPRALQEILFYRSLIPNYHYQDLLKVILSRSTRSARQIPHYDLARPKKPVKEPYYCHKHSRICTPVDECLKFLVRYSYDTIKRIKEFSRLKKSVKIEIVHGDSRTVKLNQIIDGVFTSPPYVGLINYHEQHRYAYELFDFEEKEGEEIGPEFKGQSRSAITAYKEDMKKVLCNISNYIKEGGLVFIVVNDKYNIYPEIGKSNGLELLDTIKRPVTRRTSIDTNEFYEDILMFVRR